MYTYVEHTQIFTFTYDFVYEENFAFKLDNPMGLSSILVRSRDICATDTKIWKAIIDFQDVNTCVNNKMLSFWVHGGIMLAFIAEKIMESADAAYLFFL